MFYIPIRQTGKKERAVGSINIKEVESKGLGDKLYVGEGEGGLKEDAQVSARVWTPRWGRRPGSRQVAQDQAKGRQKQGSHRYGLTTK